MEITDSYNEITYSPGHPWYYRLGGIVPTLRDIRSAVRGDGYEGCKRAEIEKVGRKSEPQRSHALRVMRGQVCDELKDNVSAYRKYALEQHRFRQSGADPTEELQMCDNVFMSLSLKHNHIYNDFAHLLKIDDLLTEQLDLFGF